MTPHGQPYDVAIAVVPIDELRSDAEAEHDSGAAIPGYADTRGTKTAVPSRRALLVQKGEEAVVAATDAIAGQIGNAAVRIAKAIEARTEPVLRDGAINIDAVEVSFGITLVSGLTTIFTAQAQSSAVVSITLSPKSAASQLAGHDH